MNKYAIYTAVIGKYDNILQPKVVDPVFDYILFSNDIKETKIGVWNVRKIDFTHKDQIKIARWVKTHPEILLPDYDFSIWMDANLQISTDYIYSHSKELFEKGTIISSIIHPQRNCIYQEMFTVFNYHIENFKTIAKWSKFLHSKNYPENNGLHETNIVFRNQTKPETRIIDDEWWKFIEKYSRRDQLSFNYVLWMLNLSCESFLQHGKSVRDSEHFNYTSHSNDQVKFHHKNNFSWLLHYWFLFPSEQKKIETIFFVILKKRVPVLWLHFYGTKCRLTIYWRRVLTKLGKKGDKPTTSNLQKKHMVKYHKSP